MRFRSFAPKWRLTERAKPLFRPKASVVIRLYSAGGRADLRKRRVAEQMARDGGIREVIDLLEQVADEQR